MTASCETHFEWLVRCVREHDRRAAPFRYRPYAPPTERRRWDLGASVTAGRHHAST